MAPGSQGPPAGEPGPGFPVVAVLSAVRFLGARRAICGSSVVPPPDALCNPSARSRILVRLPTQTRLQGWYPDVGPSAIAPGVRAPGQDQGAVVSPAVRRGVGGGPDPPDRGRPLSTLVRFPEPIPLCRGRTRHRRP